jgi:hypothetical protein
MSSSSFLHALTLDRQPLTLDNLQVVDDLFDAFDLRGDRPNAGLLVAGLDLAGQINKRIVGFPVVVRTSSIPSAIVPVVAAPDPVVPAVIAMVIPLITPTRSEQEAGRYNSAHDHSKLHKILR